jgi:hypothetical protein
MKKRTTAVVFIFISLSILLYKNMVVPLIPGTPTTIIPALVCVKGFSLFHLDPVFIALSTAICYIIYDQSSRIKEKQRGKET